MFFSNLYFNFWFSIYTAISFIFLSRLANHVCRHIIPFFYNTSLSFCPLKLATERERKREKLATKTKKYQVFFFFLSFLHTLSCYFCCCFICRTNNSNSSSSSSNTVFTEIFHISSVFQQQSVDCYCIASTS